MNGKNPHAGHRERIRKRFLDSGQDGLFEHELLELLLFYARPVINTNGIAHALTEEFGSLGKVMSADKEALTSVNGVGSAGASFLKLMYDFGTDYLRRSHSSETLSTREQLCSCFEQLFSGSSARLCALLCLNPQHGLLRTVTIPFGELLNGGISPKETAALILRSGASSVCAGLSHGDGFPIPDNSDYYVTHSLGELFSAIGIGFTDCIIYGSGKCFSMRGSGAFTF